MIWIYPRVLFRTINGIWIRCSKIPPFCFTQTKQISAGNGSQLGGKRSGPGEKIALSHYPVSLSPRSVRRNMIAKDRALICS